MRIQNEMGFNFLLLGKTTDELPTHRGFTGADIPDDDVQPAAQQQGQLQFLQTIQMLVRMKKELGIRGVGKRFFF